MKIRPLDEQDYASVVELGKKLRNTDDGKGWFTEDAYQKNIPFDICIQKGFVAEGGGNILGFITYTSYDTPPMTPLIGWIAVDPSHHRKGIGANLIEKVETEILKTGVKELYVETPTREAGIGSDYESTYEFYLGVGFVLDKVRLKNAPDNNCGCDMAVLRRVLE
ncbi:MAG: GNAT family N-acetyltransferase [Candidatus Thermoplasmatota archaeon]|nr:GNAT family N-acetyltransferase [Euryarchaeota archaeon]MBU4032830.1 GNAT family N-acetyltransferase [Candidatus Thermoplasmatota archaeon]MBU4071555.1 GNAT family N-acetyltransferase [Candidatus Thermoplasmatota archaeon]MBU4144485.1 GNAT family N-acetyltransferase [Candidatus Thermoplasmatota archaeon]MBU4592721.1 GNAT family N-acetyltransferase [Candidatus Thermoplasmatota archaeon]